MTEGRRPLAQERPQGHPVHVPRHRCVGGIEIGMGVEPQDLELTAMDFVQIGNGNDLAAAVAAEIEQRGLDVEPAQQHRKLDKIGMNHIAVDHALLGMSRCCLVGDAGDDHIFGGKHPLQALGPDRIPFTTSAPLPLRIDQNGHRSPSTALPSDCDAGQ